MLRVALARVRGISTIEDEKAIGTCHFAIGSDYNGEVITFMHLDGVVKNPTITFYFPDGSSITRNFTY